jgi:hypothetical protein
MKRAGLGLAGTALVIMAGCGGGGQSDAHVRLEPGTSLTPGAGGTSKTVPTAAAPAETGKTSTGGSTAPTTSVKAEGWGTLKGQVVFGSNPPEPEALIEKGKASKDPEFCAADGPIKSERLVVDAATKGVKNVIVYIPKPTAVNDEAKAAAAKASVQFDQVKCVFTPHVLALMSNADIEIKSSDQVNHNVDAKLRVNQTFNQIVTKAKAIHLAPKAAERSPCEIICDIHPWMKAYWLIVDSPYFAVTDDKGNYEIKNVPAGTQKVVVWQESLKSGGFVTPSSGEPVDIKANDTTAKDFTIDPGKLLPAK